MAFKSKNIFFTLFVTASSALYADNFPMENDIIVGEARSSYLDGGGMALGHSTNDYQEDRFGIGFFLDSIILLSENDMLAYFGINTRIVAEKDAGVYAVRFAEFLEGGLFYAPIKENCGPFFGASFDGRVEGALGLSSSNNGTAQKKTLNDYQLDFGLGAFSGAHCHFDGVRFMVGAGLSPYFLIQEPIAGNVSLNSYGLAGKAFAIFSLENQLFLKATAEETLMGGGQDITRYMAYGRFTPGVHSLYLYGGAFHSRYNDVDAQDKKSPVRVNEFQLGIGFSF